MENQHLQEEAIDSLLMYAFLSNLDFYLYTTINIW